MKYVVYYDTNRFGLDLENNGAKKFRDNVERVLGPLVIWIPADYTTVEVIPG